MPFTYTYGAGATGPWIKDIADFFADAEAGNLPSVSYVEPTLTALNVIGNDDHPPADVRDGQQFIATVYNALANSPQWGKTLLVVIYDEHGGFFDHVPPPTTFDPLPEFEQLGFRVPALVVGGQTYRGCANATVFDHVSVLATICRRFDLEPLTERVSHAADLGSCLDPARAEDPRPPLLLRSAPVTPEPQVVVDRHVGGQDELARLLESGDPGAAERWRAQARAAVATVRAQGRRLDRLRRS